jgi:hypothetical protein
MLMLQLSKKREVGRERKREETGDAPALAMHACTSSSTALLYSSKKRELAEHGLR